MIRTRSRQPGGRIREQVSTTLSKNFAVRGQLLEGAVNQGRKFIQYGGKYRLLKADGNE